MNRPIKYILMATIFCLAGCMRHRTEEVSLPNGYALTKMPVEAGATRSLLTRTVQDRKAVIAEWVSENGMVLSIMPTPTSASGLIKSSYFIPYEFGDNNPEGRIELVQEDITFNGTGLDLPAFTRIIDKLKSFTQGSPVLAVTLPIREAQLIDVVRLITAYAGNGLAILQHSYEGAEVVDIETFRRMFPRQETQPHPPIDADHSISVWKDGPSSSLDSPVTQGLGWLVSNQNKDGSWGDKPVELKASTGLALLAFLGHGETVASEEYGKTVTRGFRFLLSDMQTTNQVGQPSAIGYAIATWALCEGYNLMSIPAFKSPAEESLAVIVKGQRESGLWGGNYRRGDSEDDIEASIWQFIALTSGLKMRSEADGLKESLERASKAMEKVLESKPDVGTTAGAVLCLQLCGKSKIPISRSALESLDTVVPDWTNPVFKDPLFRWLLITQALLQKGGDSWIRWNRLFHPMLTRSQKASRDTDDKMIGYWDSPGTGERFGRVFSTAMSTLIMEVYYRYLPLFIPYQQPDDENLSINDVVIKIE